MVSSGSRSPQRAAAGEVEALQHHGGGEEGGHAPHVVRRAHGVDVEGDEVEAREALEELEALTRRRPAPGGRAHAGGAARVEEIHVEAEVDRAPAQLGVNVREDVGNPAPEELDAVDQLVAVS